MDQQIKLREETDMHGAIIFNTREGEALRIEHDGRIFWKGREVEADDQFRAAMIELKEAIANPVYVFNAGAELCNELDGKWDTRPSG